ncbi:uncharacterized protein METZ01_LOCUS295851, partial [marine metagenome]
PDSPTAPAIFRNSTPSKEMILLPTSSENTAARRVKN